MHKYNKFINIIDTNTLTKVLLIIFGINFLSYAFLDVTEILFYMRMIASVVLIIMLFTKKKYAYLDLLLFFIVVYLIIVNGAITINIAFILLLTICMPDITGKKLYGYINKIDWVLWIVVVVSVGLGIRENVDCSQVDRIRFTLGFTHPNFVGLFWFSTVMMWYLSKEHINKIEVFLIAIISSVLFIATSSRTGMLAVLLVFIMHWVFKFLKRRGLFGGTIFIEILLFLSPVIWSLDTVNNEYFNKVLSLRPMIFNAYIIDNSIFNLFLGGSNGAQIDNFYLLLLFNCGIGVYIIVAMFTLFATWYFFKVFKQKEVIFILVVLFIGLTEGSIIRPEILCMVVFWKLIYMGVKRFVLIKL